MCGRLQRRMDHDISYLWFQSEISSMVSVLEEYLSATKTNQQISKQNITRDIEIKNKVTVTRGEGTCHQGTCIKDTWTKPRGVGSRVGGRYGWGGEWRQLYLKNSNKNI